MKTIKEIKYIEEQLEIIEQQLFDCDISDTEKIRELSNQKQKWIMRLDFLSS